MAPGALRALVVQAVVFWTLVCALHAAPVSLAAWWALYGLLAFGLWGAHRWRATATRPPRFWGELALYSLLGAVVFAGANFGMDTLHGAHRPKAQVAAHLGGLELWFFLCPGVFSLALGGWAARSKALRRGCTRLGSRLR
jgi:hypothetical protein